MSEAEIKLALVQMVLNSRIEFITVEDVLKAVREINGFVNGLDSK